MIFQTILWCPCAVNDVLYLEKGYTTHNSAWKGECIIIKIYGNLRKIIWGYSSYKNNAIVLT